MQTNATAFKSILNLSFVQKWQVCILMVICGAVELFSVKLRGEAHERVLHKIFERDFL